MQKQKLIEEQLSQEFGIPTYNLSPEERLKSILIYRNDRRLYRRKCDETGEVIISAYRPDTNYKIIKSSLWWGDSWDGLDYGFIPDKNKDFFEQFAQLQQKVPREGTSVVNCENSEFNSHTRDSKNVYLSHLVARSEDALYSYWSVDNKDICDCNYIAKSTLCYECNYATNCYSCFFVNESANCTDCYVSYQLRNCQNCILCSNLNNKSYHFNNKPCTKEQFEKLKTAYLKNLARAKQDLSNLMDNTLNRARHSRNSENISGEHIHNSKDCFNCFDIMNSQNCYNLTNGGGTNIAHGYSVGFPECENVFCSVTLRTCQNIFFSSNCWSSSQLWYCDNCVSCSDCFACVGLKHKKYCFFNKQLSEIEYQKTFSEWKKILIDKQQFGHFFPANYSPFYYNESTAQDFFPLTKTEIISQNLRWYEFPERLFANKVTGEELKLCTKCTLPFRLAKKEQEFYLKNGISGVECCPECRLESRLATRNPYSLFTAQCSKCRVDLQTSFKNKKVLCDECFLDLY